ncbi:RDD family protein [Aeromonas veronii]
MEYWWYEHNGIATGPVEYDDLYQMILAGELCRDTLAWRSGMSEWSKIVELKEFGSLPPPLPSRAHVIIKDKTNLVSYIKPTPASEISTEASSEAPTPWRRFFARTFDFLWIGLFLLFIFNWLLNVAVASNIIKSERQIYNFYIIFLLFYQPAIMLIDAIITAKYSANLGKYLLGLRIVQIDNTYPSFSQILKRNMNVMMAGMGFSIPFVALTTQIYQLYMLKNKGSTSYDKNQFKVVSVKKYHFFSYLALSSLLMVAYMFFNYLYL